MLLYGMPLSYQITRLPRFVRFKVSGAAELADMHALIEAVARDSAGDRRALVDRRDVQENLRFTDHYAIGELVARRLNHLERLGSLVPPERRTGTSEKVATAQGTALRVFVDDDQACAWLSGD